jgi:signal transduction histidine kinase
MLARLISAWTPAAENAGLTLTLEAPKECICRADEAALERIMANVVSNAVKFTPPSGRIAVKLIARDADIEISVADTGIGLDPEFRSRMFQRFEQGRPAVRAGARGSGLGLAIVRELVDRHAGELKVLDNPGGGTIFAIVLPRELISVLPADGDSAGVQRGWSVDIPLASQAGEQSILCEGTPAATVLIAEDDPELRRAVADVLKDSYRVISAPDGNAAIELAAQHCPDMLISDVAMPGMDGLELTRRFRALPGNRLAPVLLLSAFGDLGDRLQGFEAGAVDYVQKPFEPAELHARIRSQLALRDLALRLHEGEKLASLGVLSAGLAHEIRNPANAVVNAIEPLKRLLPGEVLDPEAPAAQLIGLIEDGAAQIAQLSRQLLGYTRNGALAHQSEPFQKILGRALVMAGSADQVVIKKDLSYAGSIHCAAPLVAQVLTNLIDNAIHAAGPGGWIKISTHANEGTLFVDVEDSGPGVPPDLKERIFEPFFTTKPPGVGTGLGLTTSRQIAEQHGGALRVIDGPGGSMFRLELPLAVPEARRSA